MATAVLILLMAAALMVSAFLSASETAAFQIGRSDLKALSAPAPVARALERILSHRRRTLVTVLLANLVVNLFYMNVGQALSAEIGPHLGSKGHIVVDALVLFTLLLLAEILPKTFALNHPMQVASL